MGAESRVLVNDPKKTRETVPEQNKDYQSIKNRIRQSLLNVRKTGMEKVSSSFLKSFYDLKEAEYLAKQKAVREEQLRLTGRAKFGKGTSFSPNADYANCHCYRRNGFKRACIVTSVIVANEEEGDEN